MIKIAVLGYGVVGTGLVELVHKNKNSNMYSEELQISNILVRDVNKHKNKKYYEVLTTDFNEIIDKSIDILVEVMGGLYPTYEYVKEALTRGIHVVTANKELIAEYGKELLDIASKYNVLLNFEASVAGGTPVVKPLVESLSVNEIKSIEAILNGTTNFILSKMYKDNMNYDDALKLAQENGFAETNADSDVLGYDAARKLSILSTIAYNKQVKWNDMNIEGISDIDVDDFKYAKLLKCCIKLLGVSKIEKESIYASVSPVLVDVNSHIAKVDNEFNTVIINGDAVGKVFFTGKGAGMFPTGSAVFSDVVDIINNKNKKKLIFSEKEAIVNKFYNTEREYVVRVNTNDRLETISLLVDQFKNINIFSKNISSKEEVAALIKVENEDILDKKIKYISKFSYINKVKKIPKIVS